MKTLFHSSTPIAAPTATADFSPTLVRPRSRWLAAVCLGLLSVAVAPAATFNVKTYGAKGDGSAVDTTAVNNAITAANSAGGGIVEFPSGKYKCGSIHLKSNVTLQLDSGSAILANSSGIDAPESNAFSSYQDFGHSHFHDALIWGESLVNIGITGPGTIDGNGNLQTSTPGSGQGDKAVSLRECDGVILSDFTIKRGGWFGLLTNGTNHLVMHDVQILDSDQRDAFDLINAQHADIGNCTIEGSDDAMCLKADYALGRKVTNTDIVVDHCSILSTGNNAVQFGSETVGDFNDVTFSHLTITSAGKAGLGVTSNDGAIIDGVSFSDITMTGCVTPIWLKITNNHRAPGSPPPGRIRNISFINITSSSQPSGAITSTVEGCGTVSPAIPIENIVFNNVKLTVPGGGTASQVSNVPPTDDHWQPRYLGTAPSYGFFLRHVTGISFINCQTRFSSTDNRAVVVCDNDGQNIQVDGLNAQVGSSAPYDLSFLNTTGYQATNCVNTSGATLRVHTSGSSAATIASPPVFTPYSGTYPVGQTVALASSTAGATIRYTTDGGTPTASAGTVYSSPLTLDTDATLRALATASGQTASAVNTAIYQVSGAVNQVATPTFSPAGGTFTSAQSVTIATTTGGASIRYTTDGSTPSSTVGTPYSGAIAVNTTTTIRAIAYASGLTDSTIASSTYTIAGPTLAWEAEGLTRTTDGTSATNDTDSAASGGVRVTLNATAAGKWMQFTLPGVPAGTYSLQLAYKTNANRGQATFLIDGAAVGGTLDQYAASSSYPTATVATVTFATTGDHTFRMTVPSKNSASSGYTLSADKITLVAQ